MRHDKHEIYTKNIFKIAYLEKKFKKYFTTCKWTNENECELLVEISTCELIENYLPSKHGKNP